MKQKKIFGFDYTDNEYMKIFMYLLVGGSAALLEWGLFFVFFSVLTHAGIFSLQTQKHRDNRTGHDFRNHRIQP